MDTTIETLEIRILTASDMDLLNNADPDLFDGSVDGNLVAEFFYDSRHHIAAAIASGTVVGFASAIHYVHPDKQAELWINEVGVSASLRCQGVGKRLLRTLFEHGQKLGCKEAWVLTENDNLAARRLYASVGGNESTVSYCTFSLTGKNREVFGGGKQNEER